MRRGITLIEVLVTVAIIATLAGILLPSLSGARAAARQIACASNLRQLGAANEVYAVDYRGHYAPGAPEFVMSNRVRWFGARPPETDVFTVTGGPLSAYLAAGNALGVRACPGFMRELEELAASDRGFERGCGGYGYNNAYVGTSRGSDGRLLSDLVGASQVLFRTPHQTVHFTDSAFAVGGPVARGIIEYSFAEPRKHLDQPAWRLDPSIHFRHAPTPGTGARACVAWLDGHVGTELRTFTWSSGFYRTPARDAMVGWFGASDDNALFDME